MPTIDAITTKASEAAIQSQMTGAEKAASMRGSSSVSGKKDVAKDFEAFVLQSFVQELLPQDSENVFGGGLAGGYWRSMLAEKLGQVMAESGSIGIADMVRDAVQRKQAALTGPNGIAGKAAPLSDASLQAASLSAGDVSDVSALAGSTSYGE